ncbi:autoinducer-2 kinase [Pseudotabrizicola formosa]|uniref:autoinducer-2 kinase n=1 Tax=Pseudotabrizicola formosa TaxID=2030009 RepID=UPI000CD10176|nr:autoinducer-2 kinase [Pseudotabrizicola formosa]
MTRYFLAIDAGTGSGRAVIFDQSGNQVGMGQQEWTHISEPGVQGSMAFDCQANWRILSDCIRASVADAGISADQIAAVSSTSMREGIVLYDRDGRELWACANVDGRAVQEVIDLKRQDDGMEAAFYAVSGQTFALGAWPRLEWLRRNRPALLDKAAKVSMINDWVLARLCGEIVTEPSNGGTSGLIDLSTRQWSPELIARTGLASDLFPAMVEPGTAVGRVSYKAAAETGLTVGTAVICGGGDVQLGTLGLGLVDEGAAAVLGGTFWQQVINIGQGRTDSTMRVRINPHVQNNLNQAECISFFVGLTMRWFRDTFCQDEKAHAAAHGLDAYTVLEQMAAQVPAGANGIIPIFSDAMDFGRWYHAAPSFLNMSIDPGHTTKASLFRALQENAAIVSAVNLDRVLDFAGVSIDRPVVFAGGASKGALWSQILADVLGRPVAIPKVREATALGCAAAAACGVGQFATLAEAGRSFAATDRIVEPNTANASVYARARTDWMQAYAAQKALVDQGVTTSLWKAPGT